MKKIRFTLVAVMSLISMLVFGAVAFASTDFTQFGFPKVIAEKKIKADEAAKISHSGIKIDIPEGTFSNDVVFQVLEGDNRSFQANAPEGETVIMNFAFRVLDSKTNEIIAKFNNPVMFSFKDKDVNEGSLYYNVKPDGSIALNSVPAVIEDRTLTHGIGATPVGWLITSPTNSINK
ncbi:hypothetical protein CN514_19415 [Bacillus sp. AFS001701]|uniref:hypothetical protein n=1 Tax=Bacillaceae TaxID=186817 RepID=UPI000BF30250|nr:hypothetical protein [Bacillus sp. AFS001701]PET51331.1 hypothetical protein CN514_19415 [Bacillus sp. AFS001701]